MAQETTFTVDIPEEYSARSTSYATLDAKNTAGAGHSAIQPLISKYGWNMANLLTSRNLADGFEADRITATNDARINYQICYSDLKNVEPHLRGMFNFIKVLNAPNYTQGKDWGADINANGKTTMPIDAHDLYLAFQICLAKHNSYPVGTSPLLPYLTEQGIDLTADGIIWHNLEGHYQLFYIDQDNALTLLVSRDNAFAPCLDVMVKCKEFLVILKSQNLRTLTEWGFIVNGAKPQETIQVSTILQGESKIINRIVVGSIFTNLSAGKVTITNGRVPNGKEVTIVAGGTFTIKKGYTSSLVTNVDNVAIAKVSSITKRKR